MSSLLAASFSWFTSLTEGSRMAATTCHCHGYREFLYVMGQIDRSEQQYRTRSKKKKTGLLKALTLFRIRGGQMVRWCWVNFQCRGVLLIRMIVGQGPTALAVGAGGVVWTFFLSSIILSLLHHLISLLSPFLPLSLRDGPI